jgi:hypothetical protein
MMRYRCGNRMIQDREVLMDDRSPPASAARRKLLRSAAAAPAIFTLPCGAALAATSVTCVAKSESMRSSAKGLTAGTDNWVRVRIQVQNAWFKAGTESPIQYKAINVAGKWYHAYDGVGVIKAGVEIAIPLFSPPGKLPAPIPGTYVYGLVDYSKSGATGYGYFPADGPVAQPVAGASCWNSMPHTQAANRVGNLLN